MGKHHESKDLAASRTSRSLLAVSLAASLAAFGCTTNQNLGNGTPVRSGGELRSAPTSGVTSGQERATPPPMTSSYNRADVLPRVTPRTVSRSERAAAIMSGQQQALRGRYLGPASPGSGGRGYVSDFNRPFVNPALQTNPQLTVNSSISSQPVPIVGATGDGGFVDAGGGFTASSGAPGSGFAAPAFATGTPTAAAAGTGAVTTAASAAAPTPTAVGTGLADGTFAATRGTATESISVNPPVTAASTGVGRAGFATTSVNTNTNTAGAGTGNAGTAGTTATTAAANTNVTAASSTGAVRVIRTNGSTVITNVGTTGRQ